MAVFKDRVTQITTTAGTGNITLSGDVPQHQSFDKAFGLNDSFEYSIQPKDPLIDEWEVGVGYLSANNVLVRSTVNSSSNADNKVDFSAGEKYVFAVFSAAEITDIQNKLAGVGDGLVVVGAKLNEAGTKIVNIKNPDNTDYSASGSPVTITGNNAVGQTITAILAEGWTATDYQWLRNGSNIAGATSASYTLVEADDEMPVTCRASGLAFAGTALTVGGVVVAPTLNNLTLANATFTTATASGQIISAIENKTAGSTITTTDDRFTISGSNLLRGLGAVTAENSSVELVETLAGATNTPRTTTVPITISEPVSLPLQAVTQYNKIHRAMETRSGTNAKVDTWTSRIGSAPVTEIGVQITNGVFRSNGVYTSLSARTFEVWVWYNAVCIKMTLNGSQVYSASAGEVDITSTLVPASAFGVSEFPVNALIGYKCRQVFATGDTVGFNARDVRSSSEHQSVFYDTATTTIGNEDGVGKFTLTGGTPQARNNGFQPFIIGRFNTVDAPVFVATGDSNTDGVGDSSDISDALGGGWFQKLMANFYNDAPTASMNLAVSGATSIHALTSEITTYFKYANQAITAFGTNDMGTAGTGDLSVYYSNTNQIIANMKAAGINNVHSSQLPPRSDSTDLWVTSINQTPLTGWDDPTDNSSLLNANLDTATNVDSVISLNSVREVGDIYKWLTDGVTERLTAYDNTHLSANGNALRAAEAKTHLNTFYSW